MTTRERETRSHRTPDGTRPNHANLRRFLAERTRKAKQRAAQAWEDERIQMAASTAAAVATLIIWNLAALKFFEVL